MGRVISGNAEPQLGENSSYSPSWGLAFPGFYSQLMNRTVQDTFLAIAEFAADFEAPGWLEFWDFEGEGVAVDGRF